MRDLETQLRRLVDDGAPPISIDAVRGGRGNRPVEVPARAAPGRWPVLAGVAAALCIVLAGIGLGWTAARDDVGDGRTVDVGPTSVSTSTTSRPWGWLAGEAGLGRRLTPTRAELPAFPPTAELEDAAAEVPPERRRLFGVDDAGNILGWLTDDPRSNVQPVFAPNGSLLGIYISGLGIVERDAYDDPAFDSEAAARIKWGEAEYRERLQAKGDAARPDDGSSPSPASVEVPDGWSALDIGAVRFAVPADWEVSDGRTSSCASPDVGLVVVIPDAPVPPDDGSPCTPAAPASTVIFEPATPPSPPQTVTMLGTVPAVRVAEPSCPDCTATFRISDTLQVRATGPDGARVLETFAPGGGELVRRDAVAASTEGWTTIELDGLKLDVPPGWERVDLEQSYWSLPNSAGGRTNPGECGGAMFQAGSAYVGASPIVPMCPYTGRESLDVLTPNDGVWIRRADATTGDLGAPVVSGIVGDLEVTLLGVDPSHRSMPLPVLDLEVRHGGTTFWVTVGVGADPVVARAVLESLRAS
ncbi:MAG: hypothetical protein KDB36_08370 [Acidimicrobiales bacterium]|nr:hypothetical protein [Acidimicrobiales bacterium]